MNPPKPAAMITQMGFTPISQMSKAPTIGIQQFTKEILALLARLNVGTAIRATTAGRMPAKHAATILLS